MDYAFCRREDEGRVVPLLVMKHRQTRAVRCWVVPQKGALDEVAAEIAEHGLRDMGAQGGVLLKSDDSEEATTALRHRVQALHTGSVFAQMPTAHEHAPHGVVENSNGLEKGLRRVL